MRAPLPFSLLLLLSGLSGLAVVGCKSDKSSEPTTATLSGVTPQTGYIGRTVEVTVTGVNTHFAGEPIFDLNDPAVKTVRAEVLSLTSAKLQVEIGDGAVSGPHDVTVKTPGQGDVREERATLQGGFTITSSLKHQGAAGGTALPGALVDFDLANVDKDNPFNGPAPVLVSGGVIVRYTDVTPQRIAGTALVDALAPVGSLTFRLVAPNAKGETITFASAADDPLAPKVTAQRAPYGITPGKVEPNESIGAPRQSNLYKVNVPAEDQVFYLAFGTVGASLQTISGAHLTGAIAPATGKFGEGRLFDSTYDNAAGARAALGLVRKAGDTYFAVHSSDLSGGPSEYNYAMRLVLANALKFSMKEPATPDGPSTPLTTFEIDAPTFAVDGAIDVADDADYILFTPKKAGRIFVQATPTGTTVPLNITVYGDDPGAAFCTAFMAGGLGKTQAEFKARGDVTYCVRINSTTRLTTPYELVMSPEL